MVSYNPLPNHAASKSAIISGGNGFIAQHTIKQLLEKDYEVIATVRSDDKGQKLAKTINSPNFKYEVVPVIEKVGAFDDVLLKYPHVKTFLHTASPVMFEYNDPLNELLKPAIEGTQNLLNSIYKNGAQIKKLVVTSSLAALANHFQNQNPNFIIDEKSYNNATLEESFTNGYAYWGSKALAEKVVWDFKRKNYPNFEVTMIMPVFTIGPQAYDESVNPVLNVTSELLHQLLKLGKNDPVPQYTDSYIDVRNIAAAHVSAVENENTNGERLLVRNSRFNYQLVLDIIHKKFPEVAKNLPIGKPIRDYETEVFQTVAFLDDRRTRDILQIDYIDLETSIVDMVNQLLRTKTIS